MARDSICAVVNADETEFPKRVVEIIVGVGDIAIGRREPIAPGLVVRESTGPSPENGKNPSN